MKRIFFVALMLIGITAGVNAQRGTDAPRFHMGIRGGFTTSSFSGSDADALPFAYGGLGFDFKLASIPLYMESGLYYMNKGLKVGDKTFNCHSVVMPLLASYHFYVTDKMSIQPFAGPYVAYGLNDDNIYSDDDQCFDAGVRIGCGWNFGRLYANMGYDIGVVKHDIAYGSSSRYYSYDSATNGTDRTDYYCNR